MAQAEKISQRDENTGLWGIVPGDAQQALPIMIGLSHPEVRDLRGAA